MKRATSLLVIFGLCLAPPSLAQEGMEGEPPGDMPHDMPPPPEPPPPLDSDIAEWFVGEWEGKSMSPMGEAVEWRKYEIGLGGQFLLIQATSTHVDPEGGEGMVYEGMGAMTKGPEGHWVGIWIDNMRGMYKGRGRREEDRIHMAWEGPMGVAHRMIGKVDDNTYEARSKMVMPDGHEMVEKLLLHRIAE